jgi:hypothetical protein
VFDRLIAKFQANELMGLVCSQKDSIAQICEEGFVFAILYLQFSLGFGIVELRKQG